MSAPIEVKVPDIGDFKDVPVIEIHVKPGDVVKAEDSLVTLESDKATMDVPAPLAGTVKEVQVKIGDKVAEGSLVLLLEASAAAAAEPPLATVSAVPAAPIAAGAPRQGGRARRIGGGGGRSLQPAADGGGADHGARHASACRRPPRSSRHPVAARRTPARRCAASPASWASMWQVKGTGPKGRITQADVQAYVKAALAGQWPTRLPRRPWRRAAA